MYNTIHDLTNKYFQDTIVMRRTMHAFPETAWLEIHTAAYIATHLEKLDFQLHLGKDVINATSRMGLPSKREFEKAYQKAREAGVSSKHLQVFKNGFTGIVATKKMGTGPVVAIRFDIDALPVQEDKQPTHRCVEDGYISKHKNSMHACGHDGHTAIGLTIARIIDDISDCLQGTIKLIFQPAEEGVRGAKSMVDSHILDDVDYLYACHIFPRQKKDKNIDIYVGMNEAFATTKLDVTYHGVSSHAAEMPQFGRNAILSAAACITNLHSIPRNSDGCTRINVGTIIAGTGRNIVAETAKLEIEVRGASTKLNEYMEVYAHDVITGAALMHDNEVVIETVGSSTSITCSKPFMEEIKDVINKNLPTIKVARKNESPLLASDDFSIMMNHVQMRGGNATYLKVLSDTTAMLHHPSYDFDEYSMHNAITSLTSIAYHLLKK